MHIFFDVQDVCFEYLRIEQENWKENVEYLKTENIIWYM